MQFDPHRWELAALAYAGAPAVRRRSLADALELLAADVACKVTVIDRIAPRDLHEDTDSIILPKLQEK